LIKPVDYSKPVNRGAQILLAAPMAVFGLLATGVGILIFYFAITENDVPANALCAGALFLPVGIVCLSIMWRLATGRSGRRDGGLFSPLVLRLWGAVFLSYPLLFYLLNSLMVFESLLSIGAGIACFRLASHREKVAFGNSSAVRNGAKDLSDTDDFN
jgi:hypothetical protein